MIRNIIIIIFITIIIVIFRNAVAYAACTLNPRADGLISAIDIQGRFGTTAGACVKDSQAPLLSFKIPSYSDLKQIYYTSSKAPSQTFGDTLPAITDGIYYFTGGGDLNIFGSPTGTGTGVIFTDGNLNIIGNITYGSGTTGLVFIVGGNISIDPDVTEVNAVLISQGKIYTAATAGGTCVKSSVQKPPLIINGSLISLTEPIIFCRTQANNTCATCYSEKVNYQPKYLVILKDLMARQFQIWSEVITP